MDNSESLIRQQNSKFSKDSNKKAHIMRANALALNETIVPSSSEWACRKKFALQIRTTATPPLPTN